MALTVQHSLRDLTVLADWDACTLRLQALCLLVELCRSMEGLLALMLGSSSAAWCLVRKMYRLAVAVRSEPEVR